LRYRILRGEDGPLSAEILATQHGGATFGEGI